MKLLKSLASCATALTLLGLLCPSPPARADETYPKREVRGAWVAGLGIDWPITGKSQSAATASCQQYLDVLKAAGVNCIYFHVRPRSDRFYALNSYTFEGVTYKVAEPWSGDCSTARGTDPGYDPLALWVTECHKRGMEIHAWVNPYRHASTTTKFTTTEDQATYDWLFTNNKWVCWNPALEQTKARIRNVCIVLTGNYDIDGIVFDDYFYPSGGTSESSSSAPDWTQYQAYKKSGGTMSIANWRRENANDMVRIVNEWIHKIKPWVKFGISPAGGSGAAGITSAEKNSIPGLPTPTWSDWAYSEIYCDAMTWLREGTVDYISPQLYWKTNHSTNPFGPMTKWWSLVAQKFGRHFYASHSISFLNTEGNTSTNHNELVNQVKLNRDYNQGNYGSVFYSACNMDGAKNRGLGDALVAQVFQCQAATPAITWYPASDPGMVQNLKHANNKLSWTAIGNNRYIAYALPNSTSPDQAVSEKGGFRAEYILDITYTNSIDIPTAKQNGYWYAVSVLDRYGNEWTPSEIGAPETQVDPTTVTLSSPKNGRTATVDQVFKWTGTSGATFTFEISPTSDFSTVAYTKSGVDLLSVTMDFTDWANKQTYYWRVRAAKTGMLSTTSDVRSFVTPTEPDVVLSLTSPAANATVALSQTFSWTGTAGADYLFEVSQKSDFSTIRHTVQGTDKFSETIDFTNWPSSTKMYWRVTGSKHGYNHVSLSQAFTTPEAPPFTPATLISPDNGKRFTPSESVVQFTVTQTGADQTILEVAHDADFTDICYTGHTQWVSDTDNPGVIRYTVPLTQFLDATHYWRVRTLKGEQQQGISETRTFTVETGNAGPSGTEPGYVMYHENYEYPLASTPTASLQSSSPTSGCATPTTIR